MPFEVSEFDARHAVHNILVLLTETGLAKNLEEARLLIKEKKIKINGETVNDIKTEVRIRKEGTKIQKGDTRLVKAVRRYF